eukprot:gnl/MRDRNA2_/MRDRNA2_104512_c0_seq1.p1 gnl/MRDRNA2_/MRDRNA2_104512_c0~~gnl/MRDRNA2_/MRDRNA2_104512_c0_seq1.p1  ORF type:complete len:581 (+),score=64.75 gnl/MRDRNA2_/MRDRNA2_104512_c0_seq1:117-1859(+)
MRCNLSQRKPVICSSIIVILLTSLVRAHSTELHTNHTGDSQNGMNTVVSSLANNLFTQALKVKNVRPFQPALSTPSFRYSTEPVWPVQHTWPLQHSWPSMKSPLLQPTGSTRGNLLSIKAVQDAEQDVVSTPSPLKAEVLYKLPEDIVEDIKSKAPIVTFIRGSALRLFGPIAGLKGRRNLQTVETLSDHAPLENDGIHTWNVMVKGKLVPVKDRRGELAFANICFRDIEEAFENKALEDPIEGFAVYNARMYAVARVVLHMIEQSPDFKAFFLQEASSVLMDHFESEAFKEDIERLNLELQRTQSLITIVNKDMLGKKWRRQNDEAIQAIAKSVSNMYTGLNFHMPRSYAMKGSEAIFINVHVQNIATRARIGKKAQASRAAAIVEFVSGVAQKYPAHMIYVGGDMNTYINELEDSNSAKDLMSIFAGNGANGRRERIPLPHPIDAIIVHQRTAVPEHRPDKAYLVEQQLQEWKRLMAEQQLNKTLQRNATATLAPAYLPIVSTPKPQPWRDWGGPEYYKPKYSNKPRPRQRLLEYLPNIINIPAAWLVGLFAGSGISFALLHFYRGSLWFRKRSISIE